MPIYEQAYRRWQARGPLRRLRFWPITREALRLVVTRRVFLGLLAIGWLPFVARLIQLYVATRWEQAAAVLPPGGRLFGEFLNQQLGLCLLLSIFAGAGLIANDLRTGGILVYLSRPLSRRDYVAGKLGALLAVNLSVTLLPALMLYAAALALMPGRFLASELLWVGPAIAAQSLLASLTISLLALAVSALSRSARVAGLALFGLWVGLEITRAVATNILDRPEAALLSVQADLRAVGGALFGLPAPSSALPWAWPALAVAAAAAGCLAVLRARVRAVEVVR